MEVLGQIQANDGVERAKEVSKMKRFRIRVNGNWHEIEIRDLDESPISVVVDGELYRVELGPGILDVKAVEEVREELQVLAPTPALEVSELATVGGEVIAPMPGKILDVNVDVGDRVQYRDVLCILEAMKMENEIMAPVEGIVKEVGVAAGQDVLYGDVLLVIE